MKFVKYLFCLLCINSALVAGDFNGNKNSFSSKKEAGMVVGTWFSSLVAGSLGVASLVPAFVAAPFCVVAGLFVVKALKSQSEEFQSMSFWGKRLDEIEEKQNLLEQTLAKLEKKSS